MRNTRYTFEVLTEAASNSTSIAGVLRYLGIRWSGGSHHHISRRLRQLGVDTKHFTGSVHNRGCPSPTRQTPEQILVARPGGERRTKRSQLHRAMLAIGVPEQCTICCIGTRWQGKRLTLHIDHINGDFLDNRSENIRFLCPNCHTQTPTFANRRRVTLSTDSEKCVSEAITMDSDEGCDHDSAQDQLPTPDSGYMLF